MSKLNRREFKELLLEWNKSIINEYYSFFNDVAGLDVFKSGLSKQNIEHIKSVNFPAYLLVIPFPFNFPFSLYSSKSDEHIIFDKDKDSYKKVKNIIKDEFKKISLQDIKNNFGKDLLQHFSTQYKKIGIENIDIDYNPEDALEKIDKLFKDNELLLTDDIPIFIVFTKLFSDTDERNEGGLYNIGQLDKETADRFLSWLYHHDFEHMTDLPSIRSIRLHEKNVLDYLKKEYGDDIKNVLSDNTINVLDFKFYTAFEFVANSTSRMLNTYMSGDNKSSVIPSMVNMEEKEIENYIEENFINVREDILDSDRTKHLNLSEEDKKIIENEFEAIKQDIVKCAIEEAKKEVKSFREMFDSLKNKIIISAYAIES